jgi:hypothetical protein
MFEAPTSPQPKDLRTLLAGLQALVARLDPLEVPLSWAPGVWADFDRIERLAAAAKVLLAGRVDESEVWRRNGYRSPADYLAAVAGSSINGARTQLATSRRLADLPATTAAVRAGSLSPAQAESITDAATVNPGAENQLLAMASEGASLAELREQCGRAKAAGDPDPDATHDRIRRERRLRQGRDAEGAWCLHGRGTVDDSAKFNAALDEIIDELFTQARDRGEQVTREQLAYDALIEMARRQLTISWADDADEDPGAGDETAEGDGEPEPNKDRSDSSGDAGNQPQRSTQTKRRRRRTQQTSYLALLRIDLAALQRGRVEGEELCEIAGAGPIPVKRARELLGDAVLKLVVTKGVAVQSVTHLGRSPNLAQRLALAWTMPCCSVRGCPRTWIEYDHRKDWAKTHTTNLDQLDPLCPHHHSLKTKLDWALVHGTGKRAMVPPDDPRHPNHIHPSGPPGDERPVAADQLLENRRTVTATAA